MGSDENARHASLARTDRGRTTGPTLGAMAKLNEVSDWIADSLPKLIAEHDVPGAALAVLV